MVGYQSLSLSNYTIGYAGAFLLVCLIILIWYVFVKWNERTGRFSAF